MIHTVAWGMRLGMGDKEQYRSGALDGLRGIAAVAVIFYHSILHHEVLVQTVLPVPIQDLSSAGDKAIKFALSVFNGNNAVLLFFVLSGFVLNLSLHRMANAPAPSIIARFVLRRAARLYPAMFFCMACYYVLATLYAVMGWQGVTPPDLWLAFKNAILVDIVWHGPSRTIQAELLAVPFLLAAFFLSRWLGAVGLLISFCYSVFAVEQPAMVLSFPYMNAWLPAFLIGFVVADGRLSRFFAGAPAHSLVVLMLAFVLIRMFTSMNSLSSAIGEILISAAVVGFVYHGDEQNQVVRALNWKPVLYLGKVSYSLYLLNVLWLLVVWSVVDQWGVYREYPLITGIIVGVVVTVATLPFAAFSERVFEQGGVRLGLWLTKGRRPALADPAVHAAP